MKITKLKDEITKLKDKNLRKPDTIVEEINHYNIFASKSGRGVAAPRVFTQITC